MSFIRSIRPLDAAIALVATAVLGLVLFLGVSVWTHGRSVESSTPASRALAPLIAEVRAKPNDLDARMRLAQTLAVAGRENDAIAQYKEALKIRKDFTPALAGLGFLALKQKDWATGEGYFRKVIDLLEQQTGSGRDAQLESAYFYLGTSLVEQKRYEDAAEALKQSILIRRDSSDAHYQLAICYRELGYDSKYREELENTLLFDPKMPEANYDYGRVLLGAGDRAGAAEHFRISVNAAPGVDAPLRALDDLGPFEDRIEAAKAKAASDAKSALVEARVAVALSPSDTGALVLLGDLYRLTGDKNAASDAYQRALALTPDDAAAQAGLKQVQGAK